MAYLKEWNGRYRVAFRYGDQLIKGNLGAVAPKEAEGCLARIEENLRLVDRGRLENPDGADLALFLVSDGKIANRHVAPLPLTLGQLKDRFLEAHSGRYEANTMPRRGSTSATSLRRSARPSTSPGSTWRRWSRHVRPAGDDARASEQAAEPRDDP